MMEQQVRNLYTAGELDDRRIQQAVDQKMAQSKHEMDKLRKELKKRELLAKQEIDKLKAGYQKLEGQLTATTMELTLKNAELNHFRKRYGAHLATIDQNRAKRRKLDFSARKQLAMEMAIKEMDKLKAQLTATTMELNRFRKRWGADLAAIDRKREEERQKAMEARKQLAMEMAIKYNMPPLNVNRDNKDEGKSQFRPMPLELHCEWFVWLPLFFQLQLIPELCRGIYAIKGKEVKRKLERLNKWQNWDSEYLEVSADGRTVKYINDTYGWATVRAARPFCFQSSSQCQMHRICYFEVKIVVIKNWIFIGLCDGNFPFCWGVGGNLFAIHSYGCVLMEDVNVKSNSDWAFGHGDVIGCGLEIGAAVDDGQKMHVFFTRNGTICGNPFQMPASANGVELFPAVILDNYEDQIEANFGYAPFLYDLTKHNSAAGK